MWTMAAPALAASIAEAAICAGVTGTAGFLPGVSAEPVTAQAMITLRCIVPSHEIFEMSLAHGRAGGATLFAAQKGRLIACRDPVLGRNFTCPKAGLPPYVRCAKPPPPPPRGTNLRLATRRFA